MIRFLVYLLLLGSVLYLLSWWGQRVRVPVGGGSGSPNPKGSGGWFRPKKNPRETWIQIYETASIDEARTLQARLEEEEIECILYEQGKKDIHGNLLKGIGVAVPKSAAPHAQGVVSRMPA